jgi:hypothetical protein
VAALYSETDAPSPQAPGAIPRSHSSAASSPRPFTTRGPSPPRSRRAPLDVEVLPALFVREGASDTVPGQLSELVDREEVQGDGPIAAAGR